MEELKAKKKQQQEELDELLTKSEDFEKRKARRMAQKRDAKEQQRLAVEKL